MKVRILVIPVSQSPYVSEIEGDLRARSNALHDLIGGFFEAHALQGLPLDMAALGFVHEDGKRLGLPHNPTASRLLGYSNDSVSGTMVVVGPPVDGVETDCPQRLIEFFRHPL